MDIVFKPSNMTHSSCFEQIKEAMLLNAHPVFVVDLQGMVFDLLQSWLSNSAGDSKLRSQVDVIQPIAESTCTFEPLAPLRAIDIIEAETLVKDAFTAVLKQSPEYSQNWNMQTELIFMDALGLLLATDSNLDDLPKILEDAQFCAKLTAEVQAKLTSNSRFPNLLVNWSKWRLLRKTDQWSVWVEPALQCIAPALNIQRVNSGSQSTLKELNIHEFISNRHVLLANMPHSEFGRASFLMTALLIANLKLAEQQLRPSKPALMFVIPD